MKLQSTKQDEFLTGIREALDAGAKADTEKRLTGMVRDFQIRLKQHPDLVARRTVAQPPPKPRATPFLRWAAAAIVLMGGAVAGVSLLAPGLAGSFSSWMTRTTHVVASGDATSRQSIRPGDGVGPIRLGMSLDEVRKAWGEPDNAVGNTYYNYYAHGVQLAIAPAQGVHHIHCSPNSADASGFSTFAGTTPQGVGIGTTEAQVLRALGQPDQRTDSGMGALELVYRRGLVVTLDAAPAAEGPAERRVVSLSVVPSDQSPVHWSVSHQP